MTDGPRTLTIRPDGPFSLPEAAAFGFGPQPGRPKPVDTAMPMAFVLDGLQTQVGVLLRQDDDGALRGEVWGEGDLAAVERQVRRVLSLDHPADGWLDVGRRDEHIGHLQAEFPGLRPVLFYSPYEAAC